MGDVNTYSALCGWKFYLCNARNARSYAIPEGLVTRDPPPISCSIRYPAKTERRHNSRGASISLGALFKLSSLFTKWGEMRVFFKMPKRSNRRYHFDRIGRSFHFSSIWIRNTYVPRWLHLLMVRIVQQFDISCPPEAENVELFMRGVFNYDNESSFHVTQFTLHCNAVLSSKWDKF